MITLYNRLLEATGDKPKDDVELFLSKRVKLQEMAFDPKKSKGVVHPGKKQWIESGDEAINSILPTLSNEEQTYLEKISSDEYKGLVEKIEKFTGLDVKPSNVPSLITLLMNTLDEVQEIESGHAEYLEDLAKEVVFSLAEFEMVKDALDNGDVKVDLKLSGGELSNALAELDDLPEKGELSQVEKANLELADDLEKAFDTDIRRRFANLMITGSSSLKMDLYNLALPKLTELSSSLPQMYGILSSLSKLGYWVAPFGAEGAAAGSVDTAAGSEEVIPEGDIYVIKVRGSTFPFLVHELVKGVYEWLSIHSDLETAGSKDTLGKETKDFLAGPGVYKQVVSYLPSDKQNLLPLVSKLLLDLNAADLKEVLAKSSKGEKLMQDVIAKAEKSWRDYKSQVRESNLNEGISTVKEKYLDAHLISKHYFDELVKLDPTPQKKYFEWMVRTFVKDKLRGDDVIKYSVVATFDKLVNKSVNINKDINSYKGVEELYDTVKHFEDYKSKTEQKELIRSEGAKLVFQNDKAKVYIITTEEAACLYGKHTLWCTAATKSSNYFDNYYFEKKVSLYYVVANSGVKYGVTVDSKGKIDVFDEEDRKMSSIKTKSIMDELEIPFVFD